MAKKATKKATGKRSVLVFGGPRLAEPSYTWFYSALTGGILHGHPEDEAVLVTEAEAEELKRELAGGIPTDPKTWDESDEARFRRFAGKKVIEVGHAQGYEDREQGTIVERDVDLRAFLGLK